MATGVELSPAKAAVVAGVVRGPTKQAIAGELRESPGTVKSRSIRVRRKLGIHSRIRLRGMFQL